MEEQNNGQKIDAVEQMKNAPETATQSGPLIGIIIIIIVLAIGGFFFFRSLGPQDQNEEVDNQTEELLDVSDSDEIEDIEEDLVDTSLEDLDSELEDIDSLLEE